MLRNILLVPAVAAIVAPVVLRTDVMAGSSTSPETGKRLHAWPLIPCRSITGLARVQLENQVIPVLCRAPAHSYGLGFFLWSPWV
jgi:hypothetical protein